MAKNSLDIHTAIQHESFRIRLNSLSPRLRTRFSKLTDVERVFYTIVAITAIFLAVSIVFVRMKIYQVQSSTNNMRLEISETKTRIIQYNQDLQGLTSSGKVEDIANENGLIYNNSNVKRVEK